MFWNGKDSGARREITELRAQLQALERSVADMHADVIRWQKRDRTREGREAAEAGKPMRQDVTEETPVTGPAKLTPARLRILRRKLSERAVVNGAAEE